jgi:hypothetical protein
MSKRDVHYWLCQPFNENLINMDVVFDIKDDILNTVKKLGLEIKNYSGKSEENENIFLIHLIKFIYLNRNPHLLVE